MIRQLVLLAGAGLALAAAAGCNTGTDVAARPTNGKSGAPADEAPIGQPLFKPQPPPPAQPVAAAASESLLISAHTSVVNNVDLPAQRDSRILFIGTEVKPGEAPVGLVYKHRGKQYRALYDGARVEPGDVVMLLDDSEAWAKLQAASVAADSAKKVLSQAALVRSYVEKTHKGKEELHKKGQLGDVEFYESATNLARAQATEVSQEADEQSKQQELNMARTNYEYYTIRSNIGGIVQPFTRKAGGSVKALEMVLQIQGTDVLRAEGVVSIGDARRLKPDMPVTIEPTIEESQRVHRRFHTQAINAVAVSSHQPQPFIVTASDDRTVRVWDGRAQFETAIWNHPVAVRSVACTPKGATKQLCLTGAEDGKGRLWDMSPPKSGRTPLRELEGGHRGPISAVAFSPDGKACATADTQDIVLWDVESGKIRYTFPKHHLGEITSLTFTPQAKLVSASRDTTVRIWALGQEGARLEHTQEGHSGDVARLGVSHDGRYFLLDMSQTLRLMSIAAEPRTEGVVEGLTETSKFSSFAVFSHDSQLILTGTQNEGRLSVWRAPLGGNRATEVRHFVPRDRLVNFTCAAVSPFENDPFAVTGTKTGETYVWKMPTEIVKIPGTLRFIDQNAAAGTRQIRIWAEFPNDKAELLVGTNVTIVVEPAASK